MIEAGSPVEFVFLADILNTGKPLQLLPQLGRRDFRLTWYELAGTGSVDPWIKHEISPNCCGHGIGAGDVNGDVRMDIITPEGWFEAPHDPRNGDGWPELITGKRYYAHEHDPGATSRLECIGTKR